MPIYDYRCDHCGHAFSAVRSYKDEPLEVCPSCGKRPRRLVTTPSIVFKGSGWYKTDSRGTPKESAPSEGSKPDAGGKAGEAEKKAPAASADKTPSSTG